MAIAYQEMTRVRPAQASAADELPTAQGVHDETPTIEYAISNEPEIAAITVLSVDPAMPAVLEQASPDTPIEFASSAEEVFELAALGRCSVLIADQSLGRSALEKLAERIKGIEPALVTIAVGTREEGSGLVALLSRGAIDRFMIKPLEPGPTRTALQSALNQHRQLKFRQNLHAEDVPPNPMLRKLKLVIPPTESRLDNDPSIWEKLQDKTASRSPAPEAKTPEPPRAEIPAVCAIQTSIAQNAPVLENISIDHDIAITSPPQTELRNVRTLPRPSWSAVFIAVLAVAGAMGWAMRQPSSTIDTRQLIARDIADAERAFAQGNYMDPPELSAIHFFSAALQIDPTNAQAQHGLDAIVERLIDSAKDAIIEGSLVRAQTLLDSARRIRPLHRQLPYLAAQLHKAREAERSVLQSMAQTEMGTHSDRSATEAQSAIALMHPTHDARSTKLSEPRPEAQISNDTDRQRQERALKEASRAIERDDFDAARQVIDAARVLGSDPVALDALEQALASERATLTNNQLLQLAIQRTEQERLIEPIDNSAKHYIAQLAKRNAHFPGLAQAIDALGRRLMTQAQLAVYQKDFERAQQLLTSAREIGFSGADLVSAETTLRSAREPALTTTSVTPPAVSSEPTLVTYVPAEYPIEARKDGIEGWVNIRLAVNANGDVIDSHVEDGARRDLFARAAIAAVRQWKYAPAPKSAANYDRPLTVRLEFKLKG